MGCGYKACSVIVLLVVALSVGQNFPPKNSNPIDAETVSRWGQKFGTDLWHSLSQATRRESIQQQYETNPNLNVDEVDGFVLVRAMAAEVQIMMQHKIDAIKRIMELAENIALDHKYDKERGARLAEGRYHYVNAKKLNVLPEGDAGGSGEFDRYLSQYRSPEDEYYAPGYSRLNLNANPHFSGIPVNTSRSSVHVPTNVFDGEPKVINAIDWSKKLDDTFRDNYERDPSLSWQYFGSSTGFLRQYPAIKWLTYEDDPDMYDARMRDWYIKSAASSKDLVILLDTSGSMTGLRKEIAKHVVLNIMETLGEDDFLTILTFSDETRPLVPCFTDADGEPELVQATTENIAEFTEAVNNIETEEIANFTAALTSAFSLLEKYSLKSRSGKLGANCNRAIMLVTDGVPYKFQTIFQEFNEPEKKVRMFTYLIGREISDLEAAKWMACTNKGYFTHVTTLAEVKEQVLKYIPVMARPLVLLREQHPVRWTGVYADIEVPNGRSLWVIGLQKPTSRRHIHEAQGKDGSFKGYKLMTSVSIPVYNKKNHTNYTESIRVSDKKKVDKVKKVRIAELLGVAGTDVPIAQIEKLIPPYKLGVNGYSFAVNNNGYILYHPDLRPMISRYGTFQEILKPNYNSVDLSEVELVYNQRVDEPRLNDSTLYQMRREMVDQKDGISRLTVKVHMDDMKRVTIREQDYFYHNISNTPFTLGIVFPNKYGKYRVVGGLEVNDPQNRQPGNGPAANLAGDRWKLHPDWVYCEYNYGGQSGKMFDNPETNMVHFLNRLEEEKNQFDWGQSRVRPLPKCQGNGAYTPDCTKSAGIPTAGKDSHFCDKELVQALILDAQITKVFEEKTSRRDSIPGIGEFFAMMPRDNLFNIFGIKLSFVATRSGLTRWEEHKPPPSPNDPGYEEETPYDPDNPKEPHFSEVNNEATDEVWYKRAVEYHYNNPQSFVFSVPFDIGDKRPTQVTATHAIFKGKGSRKAPAAVVGVQIDYEKFRDTFMLVANKDNALSCNDNTIECYVLDNNGFVVISEDKLNTGKFFGEIDGTVLNSLVQNNVFKKIKVYDYQAICLESADDGSPASMMLTPFRLLSSLFNWIIGHIAFTIIRLELHHLWNPDWTYSFPQSNDPNVVFDGDYYAYDEYTPNEAAAEGPTSEDSSLEEEELHDPYNSHDDELVNEYMMKDGGPIPILEMTYINKTQPKPCDKEVYLYELQETVLEKMGRPLQGILRNCHDSKCERPFTVTLIPNTNLILVAADTTCPCYSARITVSPTKVDYGPVNETMYCEKLKTNLYRKRPHHCVPYHAQVN
ncbi:voltage-dependent calcium channel subunit alpha-2/delta-3 isoform X8 [Eurytemora carolleeae]|uniref:voltage-dependent calcium channel subunit alpha-2/delta-3 isoform X8 n=1 Tax=Eurytemora carolleeae TaxID=1294199 RepID=UPI000C76CE6D|nr:voltage-dependent calcium channel subunit alpha-2/delta-3 isoform X8 [Eurytemora carolleeae]|eukprot:XP_023323136.1 voltage-dependent calcium channel subunit alpha-2/delta-3-like isoform X8 [Eurytemora affinis]